ncbi:MAG: hypothetical protein K9N49_05210 [Candidatus Marinimicrobia bacterium]|nr:hypothetical protein [Candidatus Neomarinimicrobiota bacterium]
MNIEIIRAFFGWCTVINGAFLLLAFLAGALAGDWVYKLHSKWFPITREAFTLTMYCFIGGMKALFLVLNLVPYLALVMLNR